MNKSSFKNIKIIFILIFAALAQVCAGQNPQWVVYTTQNSGLPQNIVSSLACESNIVWIAGGGLTKFDRVNWVNFNTSNSNIPSNGVYVIAIDKYLNKWIGTAAAESKSGIAKFDGLNWINYDTINSPLPDNRIWSLFIDEFDNKWIGTRSKGLVKFNGTEWNIYNTENSGLPQNVITSGIVDGFIKWIGSYSNGFARFNDTNWIVYNSINSGLSNDRITDIDIDEKKNIWISTFGGGLNKFNSLDSIWTHYLSQGFLNCLLIVDKKKTKWIGSPGGGLYKFYNDTGLVNYRPENSPMPSYTVNALSLDSNGNLWIGTNGGLAVFNENGIVGIDDPKIINFPVSAKLYQNYPNPFNPTTKINYQLPKANIVSLKIYDMLGKEVATLVKQKQNAGTYSVDFNAGNLPSGIYFYTLEANNFSQTKKMLLLK